jgi:hypothetical protein
MINIKLTSRLTVKTDRFEKLNMGNMPMAGWPEAAPNAAQSGSLGATQ